MFVSTIWSGFGVDGVLNEIPNALTADHSKRDVLLGIRYDAEQGYQ